MVHKVTIVIIVGLLLAGLAGAVFYIAFGKIPVPGICELFPIPGKEVLARYYTCSQALCDGGCPSNEHEDHDVNKICLERDCTTRECKKWCNSYCFSPPSEWGTPDETWSEMGKLCGYDYYMNLSFEGEFVLLGYYCAEYNIIGVCTRWTTGLDEEIDRIRETEEDADFPNYGMAQLHELGKEEPPDWVADEPSGSNFIYMYPEEVKRSFGCAETNYWTGGGFDSCKYAGNLKLWSHYNQTNLWPPKTDVFINATVTPYAGFDLVVTPCAGEPCSERCEIIKITEEACFDVKVINNLGTSRNFNLEMWCVDGPCGEVGCTGPCENEFVPNPIVNVGHGEEGTSQLKFTPTEVGTYKLHVTAKSGLRVETRDAKVRVVDFAVRLWPSGETRVNINKEASWRVDLRNDLDKGDNFILTPNFGTAPCTLTENDGVNDNLVFVPNGTDWEYVADVRCISPVAGVWFNIRVRATSQSYPAITRDSNAVTLNVTLASCNCTSAGDDCGFTSCDGCAFCGPNVGQGVCDDGTFHRNTVFNEHCCLPGDCKRHWCTQTGMFPVCIFSDTCLSNNCILEAEPCGGRIYKTYGKITFFPGMVQCNEHCTDTGCDGCGCVQVGQGNNCCYQNCPLDCAICEEDAGQTCICDGVLGVFDWVYGKGTADDPGDQPGKEVPCCRDEDCPDWYCYHNEVSNKYVCHVPRRTSGNACVEPRCYDTGDNVYQCHVNVETGWGEWNTYADCAANCHDICHADGHICPWNECDNDPTT